MGRAEELFSEWMKEIGLDGDPELAQTSTRFTALLREFNGSKAPPEPSVFSAADSGPVVLRGVPFHSLCAHHLLPFFGTATIAYQPDAHILGFSSIASILQHHARRPQLQERLARQVCDALYEAVAPRGLVLRLTARQLCMEMRGARSAAEAEVFAASGEQGEALRALL